MFAICYGTQRGAVGERLLSIIADTAFAVKKQIALRKKS